MTEAATKPATDEVGWWCKLDELLYRLRGTGAAIQGLGVMAERQGVPGELGDLDTALQALGESIGTTVAEVREEVKRITGKPF